MAQTTILSIDVTRRQGTFSPLLFGHNLEHTRSAVFQGLSAQVLRNRKFAGKPAHTGVALAWYPIGSRSTFFDLSSSDAYTQHVDPRGRRWNELSAQRVQAMGPDICGLGQRDLPLVEGQSYDVRVVLKSDRDLQATVRFTDRDGTIEHHTEPVEVLNGDWTTHTFRFAMATGDPTACMEITFVGPGTLTIGAVSLLPVDAFHGMRRDVIACLKEIHVPILRWPGGNFAGDYRWQDGLLPVDKRGPLMSYMPVETLPHSGGHDDHDIGTDEYIALCRELGAEPFISVNLGHEGPDEAAAWVEYCNGSPDSEWGSKRAVHGHPEPYGVKYWSVGNEMGYGHMEGPNTPAGYATKARDTARAMLAKDPGLVLVLSGLYDRDNAWYTECLEPMADLVQCVSDHYYTPAVRSYLGDEAMAECARLALEPGKVADRLRQVRAFIDAHVPDRAIGISFDEWNVWYAWYRAPGVNEGIHTAAMLTMIMREALNVGLRVGCYFQPVNEGAVLVEADRAWLTANGQVFALFAAHHGNTYVPIEGGDAVVDAAASFDEEQRKLVVTLVNRDPVTAHEVILKTDAVFAEGVLLRAESFLPGSRFEETVPEVASVGKGKFRIVLPRLSVARFDGDL